MAKRRRFKHLSWNDRLRIESFLKCGKRVQEIADEIGVHRNTIYNELKRGAVYPPKFGLDRRRTV